FGLLRREVLAVLRAGEARERDHFAVLGPGARGLSDLLVAFGEIQERSDAGIELLARLKFRDRLGAFPRRRERSPLGEERFGGRLSASLSMNRQRDRKQGRHESKSKPPHAHFGTATLGVAQAPTRGGSSGTVPVVPRGSLGANVFAEVGGSNARIFAEIGARAGESNFAGDEHVRGVSRFERKPRVLLDEEDRDAGLGDRA